MTILFQGSLKVKDSDDDKRFREVVEALDRKFYTNCRSKQGTPDSTVFVYLAEPEFGVDSNDYPTLMDALLGITVFETPDKATLQIVDNELELIVESYNYAKGVYRIRHLTEDGLQFETEEYPTKHHRFAFYDAVGEAYVNLQYAQAKRLIDRYTEPIGNYLS